MVKFLTWKKKVLPRPHVRKEHVTALILTILYIVEVCLGVRTVIYVFDLWNRARLSHPLSDDISWALVAVSLMLCVLTCCSVNAISALWDSKDYNGMKSAVYFCCHILTGGIPSRFVSLWKSESAEAEKENIMLMACLKFMFSQLFSIPLMVIHVYLEYELNELFYDAITVSSVTITFALTCSAIYNYPVDVEYPHQTMALVPLIFKKKPDDEATNAEQGKHDSVGPTDQQQEIGDSHWVQKIATVVQYMLFSIGRILALGVLLKLTGIYALPIILLQFLLSVLYLKFQAVHLVPESLSKSKQLMRLAFLSYVLVFEWQLHRDSYTGYNLGFSLRHGVLYYFIATVESVFYLVVWMVTRKPPPNFILMDVATVQKDYVLWVTIIACSSLLISDAIHACLIFLRFGSRELLCKQPREFIHRASAVILNMRRASTKTSPVENDNPDAKVAGASGKSEIEDVCESVQESTDPKRSKRSNSYRDLSDNVDENVEVTHHKSIYPTRVKQELIHSKNPCDFPRDQVQETTEQCGSYQSNEVSSFPKDMHNFMVKNTVSLAKSPFTTGELKAINEGHTIEPSKANTSSKLSTYIQSKNFKSPYNLKGLKDSNFFKNLRSPKKSNSDKSPPNTKGSCSNFDVIKKVSSMTNTVSAQLAKKLSAGTTKFNKSKTDDEAKKGPDGNKIVISTIMNEYKEELPKIYGTCGTEETFGEVTRKSSDVTPEDDTQHIKPIACRRKGKNPEHVKRPVKSARWRPADSKDHPKLTDFTGRSFDTVEVDEESSYTQDVSGTVTPPPDFHECIASNATKIDDFPPVPEREPPPPPSRCRRLSPEVSIDCEDEDEEDVIYDSREFERSDPYCDNGVGTIEVCSEETINTDGDDEYVERFV